MNGGRRFSWYYTLIRSRLLVANTLVAVNAIPPSDTSSDRTFTVRVPVNNTELVTVAAVQHTRVVKATICDKKHRHFSEVHMHKLW